MSSVIVLNNTIDGDDCNYKQYYYEAKSVIDGVIIEQFNEFTYLGFETTKNYNDDVNQTRKVSVAYLCGTISRYFRNIRADTSVLSLNTLVI